jgi:hypothetical protein
MSARDPFTAAGGRAQIGKGVWAMRRDKKHENGVPEGHAA